MQSLWKRIRSWSSNRNVWIAFGLSMAFNAWFFTIGPYGAMVDHGGIVDERFGSSGPMILDHVAAYDDAGRDAYRTFLLGDLVYPFLQALWLTGFIAILTRRWRALPAGLMLVPAAAMVFDWAENLSFLILLGQSAPSLGVAWLASLAMHLKVVASVVAFLTAAVGMIWYILNPVKRKR